MQVKRGIAALQGGDSTLRSISIGGGTGGWSPGGTDLGGERDM
ncbi:hypothetical protein M116_1580 [Bacteroides fragilis str. 3719 A10]|nr:hypothetical protein M116_1580 [Bacteroides fragilis str. 3719 A10]